MISNLKEVKLDKIILNQIKKLNYQISVQVKI